ncbi:BrnT family toxin [Candidatus Thiosymbion oneisti]|uniref:BrnT family toxin n=1 Tax=Candidatus Thiosymbion oneisti TaxID=589554 RepID=UPI00105F2E0D|nr:BrnT family toxin [Candidatus Thiosymbion oneisti]
MEFEWDSSKAGINLKKHGVSFNEAQTVFDDPLACIFDDEWDSFEERRELIIGYSSDKRLLIVSFIERLPGIVRVISARQTTARERKDYENYRRY